MTPPDGMLDPRGNGRTTIVCPAALAMSDGQSVRRNVPEVRKRPPQAQGFNDAFPKRFVYRFAGNDFDHPTRESKAGVVVAPDSS